MDLDPDFWNQHYHDENTPWDLGGASPPLIAYLEKIDDPGTRILIPGAGRAYEAVYLHRRGFTHVFVCDWATAAFHHLKENAPDFPSGHLITGDFFQIEGQFDLMLEHTFFCAIHPSLRPRYVEKAAQLLNPGGVLAGLLFATEFDRPGPPFGGDPDGYHALFSPHFFIEKFEISKNSILPRAGNELFVELINKKESC